MGKKDFHDDGRTIVDMSETKQTLGILAFQPYPGEMKS